MWFLHQKVILTKDNLIKRQWIGNEKCCFCDNKESIQHLYFECPLAKIIWRIIHVTFGLAPPINITNLFGNRLKGIPKNDLIKVHVGVCDVIWARWNTRDNFVFNKPKNSFLQVIPMVTHWIRMWSYLQQEEEREAMDSRCNRLEMVARDLFSRCGWRSHNRIGP
jgi:hypothetical protein